MRRNSTKLVHYDFSTVRERPDRTELDEFRRDLMKSPKDERVAKELAWDVWRRGRNGHSIRYWTLAREDGGEPQVSPVGASRGLSQLLDRQNVLEVSLEGLTVRPRYYAADAYVADRVLRGKASRAKYASTFVRMRRASEMPKYAHEVPVSDPVGGWDGWEDTRFETYVFTEVIEFIPASPEWAINAPFEEIAQRWGHAPAARRQGRNLNFDPTAPLLRGIP